MYILWTNHIYILILIFISGINLFIFFSFFFILIGSTSYLIFFIPKFEYIKTRIFSFLDPSSGNNYQSEKASEAIIGGGFFGKGVGEGTLNTVSYTHLTLPTNREV